MPRLELSRCHGYWCHHSSQLSGVKTTYIGFRVLSFPPFPPSPRCPFPFSWEVKVELLRLIISCFAHGSVSHDILDPVQADICICMAGTLNTKDTIV